MDRTEFKILQKGEVVQFRDEAPVVIISAFPEYDHSTDPPTRHTWEIEVSDGRTMRLTDPTPWIRDLEKVADFYNGNCPKCGHLDLAYHYRGLHRGYYCRLCHYWKDAERDYENNDVHRA